MVADAIGRTLIAPVCLEMFDNDSICGFESIGGIVFGIAHNVVNPPAAPASVPVATVSLNS